MATQNLQKHLKSLILLLFLGFASSCTDQGCIEADDFGEYESQTLEISANSGQNQCVYDYTTSLNEAPSGLRVCFTTGNPIVVDESGNTQTAVGGIGCEGFSQTRHKSICVSNCVQSCLANQGASSGSAVNPPWVSTDKKTLNSSVGVTIAPGSQIFIRAIGNVTLGGNVTQPDVHVQTNNPLPHSKASNWGDVFFDVRGGQTLTLKYSGQWNNGNEDFGYNSTASTINDQAYNGSRRLAAYLIDHPSGYVFNTLAANEQAGSNHIMLLPDPVAWRCDYENSSERLQSDCHNFNDNYNIIGAYGSNAISRSLVNSTFPISSAIKTSTLTKYGGIIRWIGDGLNNEGFDPFNVVTCDNSGCNYPSSSFTNVSGRQVLTAGHGGIVGDISSSSQTITNTNAFAVKVAFKSLLSSPANNACNIGLNVTIKDQNDANVKFLTTSTGQEVQISNSAWSAKYITLEPGHKFTVEANATSFGSAINCGRAIAYRMLKYQDLRMETSGFVSFVTIGDSDSSGTCTVRGRIINPTGRLPYASSADDFYEYDSFDVVDNVPAASSQDPLSILTVSTWNTLVPISWSSRIFVRKGQVLRFAPESWNGTWSNGSHQRECGIGMAMRIEPRPALLCRGNGNELVPNPSCQPDYDPNGILLGCKPIDNNCNISSSGAYCPMQSCQKKVINCVNGSAANGFAKTGCTLSTTTNYNSANPSATNCTDAYGRPAACSACAYDSVITSASCDACSAGMLANASLAAKVNRSNMDQCYDLENYTGKVANIPAATGFSEAQLADSSIARGAIRLSGFNGTYGNLANFSDPVITDSAFPSNKVLESKYPLTFGKSGRLRFFVIDGQDFRDVVNDYSDNSASASGYNGINGYKISLGGNLEFSNGGMLQARLCKESSNDDSNPSYNCRSTDPVALLGSGTMGSFGVDLEQSQLIGFLPNAANPTSPTPSGSYKFDDFGNLSRRLDSSNSDFECKLETSGIAAGNDYYCHMYDYISPDVAKNLSQSQIDAANVNIQKLRLTFQIFDPEVANCYVTAPSSTVSPFDGIQINNPYYVSGAGATGAICNELESPSDPPPSGKSKCVKQFYCGSKYSNNTGSYYVNIRVKRPANSVGMTGSYASNLIGSVITPVVELLDGKKDRSEVYDTAGNKDLNKVGMAERLYELLINDARYKAILSMSTVMMFMFWGLGYLMGVSNLTHTEIISRMVKLGVIALFVGPAGWYWFNEIVVKFFKEGTNYLTFMMATSFDNSPELQKAIANSDYYDKSILFSSVDRVLGMFFSPVVQKKISALLFASIFGWAYIVIIYWGFLSYVYAVANAVLLYITAQFFTSILFTLGPIFFIFTLFAVTKDMFDNWLKALIGFSLQQIFLLTTLTFFNMLMYEVIKMSLGFKICWDSVWVIHIITNITLLEFWTVASLPPRTNAHTQVGNIGNPDGIPSLFSILFIWVIASLMETFITFMTNLASSIGGGIKASELSAGVTAMAKEFQGQFLGKGTLMDAIGDKLGVGKAIDRADNFLFDSGKAADKKREQQEIKNTEDQQKRSALSSAADKGVSDYKKENALKLSGMSREDQRKTLAEVGKNAAMNKAKELGLSDSDAKALMNDSGLKYTGDNVFGAVLQAGKQAVFSGGNLMNSLEEKNEARDINLSSSQAKKAMKKMNKEEREDFISSAAQGKIGVGPRSMKQAAKDAWKAAKEAVPIMNTDSYKQARDELVSEGKIQERSNELFRPDEEKKAIRDRQRQHSDKKQKPVRTSNVADLVRADEAITAKQEADKEVDEDPDKGWVERASGAVSRSWDKAKNFVSRGDSNKRAKELKTQKESAPSDEADAKPLAEEEPKKE